MASTQRLEQSTFYAKTGSHVFQEDIRDLMSDLNLMEDKIPLLPRARALDRGHTFRATLQGVGILALGVGEPARARRPSRQVVDG